MTAGQLFADGQSFVKYRTLMPDSRRRTHYQRARTEAEKSERRRSILAAADAHVRSAGFEAFSMAVLAKEAGIAKGTLYLYFETREEVLLSLYTEQLGTWCAALTERVAPGVDDREFVRVFYECALADPVLLDLSARLGSVIEHNVSRERLIESKRSMREQLLPLAEHLQSCLKLKLGQGPALVGALMALLLGAAQIDAGPTFEGEHIPDDVAEMLGMFSCRDLFLSNAAHLVRGARTEVQVED